MKRKIIGTIAVILLLGVCVFGYLAFGNYSSGYRKGHIMKISHKGVLFKTWEGQLNVGGLQAGDDGSAATTTWEFSVTNEQVLKDLEKAVDNDQEVKLHYNEKFYQFDWRGDTKYFVYKVEPVTTATH